MVEALVATAVVLVVLAVGVPAARALTGGARRSACAERLHTLGNALALYANDHDGWLPPATTAEWAHREEKGLAEGELAASPGLLVEAMRPIVPSPEAWFCPLDPHRGEKDLWLGQRHLLTSYRYDPKPAAGEEGWPPKAQLGKGDAPLVSDAFGIPAQDSDRRFQGERSPASNHPNGTVNVIGQDLSLSRRRAGERVGNAR